MQKAMLLGSKKLPNLISSSTYKKSKKICEGLGLPSMAIDQMKPWMVAMSIVQMNMAQKGFSPMHGVDMHFYQKAKINPSIVQVTLSCRHLKNWLKISAESDNLFKGQSFVSKALQSEFENTVYIYLKSSTDTHQFKNEFAQQQPLSSPIRYQIRQFWIHEK